VVTLRARLTGPSSPSCWPGADRAIFVGTTVNSVNKSRERERLDVATASLRSAIDATCARLQATAEAAAATTVAGTRPAAQQALVDGGRASAIHIESASGDSIVTTDSAPRAALGVLRGAPRWTAPAFVDHTTPRFAGDRRGARPGRPRGRVRVRRADHRSRLDAPAGPVHRCGRDPDRRAGAQHRAGGYGADHRQGGGAARRHGHRHAADRYVRRAQPIPGQPLAFALSVPIRTTNGLLATVAAVVLFAALAALGGAWALARSATRPLDEITRPRTGWRTATWTPGCRCGTTTRWVTSARRSTG